MPERIIALGHDEYEKACDNIIKAKQYVLAVDATCLKEYLEIHGFDPLYRNWVRLTLKHVSSNIHFARIYLYSKATPYLVSAVSDYLTWKSGQLTLLNGDNMPDADAVKSYQKVFDNLSNPDIYICKTDNLSPRLLNRHSLPAIVDDTYEALFSEKHNPFDGGPPVTLPFKWQYANDSSTLFKVIEDYRNYHINYLIDLQYVMANYDLEADYYATSDELECLYKCDASAYFCKYFIRKDFLMTETMIYDYLNPRAKLRQSIVAAILIDHENESFKKYSELFLFTHYILRRLFSYGVTSWSDVKKLLKDYGIGLAAYNKNVVARYSSEKWR